VNPLHKIPLVFLLMVILAGGHLPEAEQEWLTTLVGTTKRVSVASDGTQANGYSWETAISADGRFVAFASEASNLVAGDLNGHKDIFVHDLETGQTSLVSLTSSGEQWFEDCHEPAISADGRYVVFTSYYGQ
jgi:Tol biopolymer transport system component